MCLVAFYGPWFIISMDYCNKNKGDIQQNLVGWQMPYTKHFAAARDPSGVFIKAPSEMSFHRNLHLGTDFKRRCGMCKPLVTICFLPSDLACLTTWSWPHIECGKWSVQTVGRNFTFRSPALPGVLLLFPSWKGGKRARFLFFRKKSYKREAQTENEPNC